MRGVRAVLPSSVSCAIRPPRRKISLRRCFGPDHLQRPTCAFIALPPSLPASS
jgi:hypothetical protein